MGEEPVRASGGGERLAVPPKPFRRLLRWRAGLDVGLLLEWGKEGCHGAWGWRGAQAGPGQGTGGGPSSPSVSAGTAASLGGAVVQAEDSAVPLGPTVSLPPLPTLLPLSAGSCRRVVEGGVLLSPISAQQTGVRSSLLPWQHVSGGPWVLGPVVRLVPEVMAGSSPLLDPCCPMPTLCPQLIPGSSCTGLACPPEELPKGCSPILWPAGGPPLGEGGRLGQLPWASSAWDGARP